MTQTYSGGSDLLVGVNKQKRVGIFLQAS